MFTIFEEIPHVATNLLPSDVTTIVKDFAMDLLPTALGLIAILIPVGLSLWAVGFGIKKGLHYLQKNASKAV